MQGQNIPRVLSPDHRALGAAVREVRARRGMSQEGLGQAARLHRNYVGAIERGEINPTFTTLLRVTRGLSIKPLSLMVLYERNVGEAGPRHP